MNDKNQINSGCYGCKHNHNWQCIKDGICTGSVKYETISSNTSNPNYIPANTSIMSDELEINGIKYRRVNEDER